jgi:hypothetical protein
MANLTLAIKWYLKGLFPLIIYIPILSFVALGQLYIIEYLKSPIEFSILTQMLLIPLIILITGSHFFRSMLLTLFELSLLGSWVRIAVSKIIVFAIGLLPFIGLEIFVLWIGKNIGLIIPILISLLIYTSLSLLSSLSSSQVNAFMISLVLILLIPISAVEVIENYVSLGLTSGLPMGLILYLIAPLASYEYYKAGIVSVHPFFGLVTTCLLAIVMIIAYVFLFQRQELKP